MLKQKSNQFLVEEQCKNVQQFYFTGKERKNNHKSARKTYYWKLIFVICSYSTWARNHLGTKSTQGTLPREHARHVATWARNHARRVGTWARTHARHVGTWARKYARHVGTCAHKHAKHVGTGTRKACSLADSFY